MTTKKTNRRALLTSIAALAMRIVMLVGTTFAWFTDSVTRHHLIRYRFKRNASPVHHRCTGLV